MSAVSRLNGLPREAAVAELLTCCGSHAWAERMAHHRPFADLDGLLANADAVWAELEPADWLEAFRAHPRIGERRAETPQSERERAWSAGEQSGMEDADTALREALADANRAYEQRFGHIYLVCATGRTADELLALLQERLQNDPDRELATAAEEQRKITRLRLQKLLGG